MLVRFFAAPCPPLFSATSCRIGRTTVATSVRAVGSITRQAVVGVLVQYGWPSFLSLCALTQFRRSFQLVSIVPPDPSLPKRFPNLVRRDSLKRRESVLFSLWPKPPQAFPQRRKGTTNEESGFCSLQSVDFLSRLIWGGLGRPGEESYHRLQRMGSPSSSVCGNFPSRGCCEGLGALGTS